MIDPELKIQLEDIKKALTAIEKKNGPGIWRSFFNGVFGALGYIAGLAVVVVILGWTLQRLGLLQAFQDQVRNFTDLVDSAKKLIPQDSKPSTAPNSGTPPASMPAALRACEGRNAAARLPANGRSKISHRIFIFSFGNNLI